MLNLSTTFVSQAATALSLLILNRTFNQVLGPELYTIYGVVLNLITLSAIADLGMNTGLLRRIINEPNKATAFINTQLFFFIGIFLVSIPVFYWLFHHGYVKHTGNAFAYGLLVAILVAQNMISILFDVLIQSANKIFVGKVIRIGKTLLEFILLFVCIAMGNVLWLLLVSMLVNFLYIALLIYYSRKEVNYRISWRYFSLSTLKDHLGYCTWYFLAIVATVLVFNAQLMLLATLVSEVYVAKYLLVNRFYEVLRIGLTNFTIVLFPRLVSIQTDGNWKELQTLFLKVWARVFTICCIIYIALLFVGPTLFIEWSKERDPITMELFNYFGIFILLIAVDSVSAIFLSALKLNKLQTIIAIFQGIISISLAYYWVPTKGIAGMGLASIIALLCTNFIFNPLYLLFKINQQVNSNRVH